MDAKSWQLPVKRIATREKVDRAIVWNNTHTCYEQSLFGQVSSVHYSSLGGFVGCVSTNQTLILRIPHEDGALVNEQTNRRSYSVRFRDDDKMTIQAVEQRVILRSTETAFERQVQGHTRDVRDALFLSRQTFASASDDTTVKVWDLVTQSELAVGKAHTDYVRSLAYHSDGCFYSGSYDHTVMLWDARTALSAPSTVLRPAVDAPVEQLLFVPSQNWVVCSGVDVITVFDTRSSQVLSQASLHTKAVTALAYSEKHGVLISGALDQRVKFITLVGEELTAVASKKLPHPVTAVDIHPDSTEYAVGMVNGLVHISKVEAMASVRNKEGDEEDKARREAGVENIAVEDRRTKAQRYEDMLKRKTAAVRQLLVVFQYHKALQSALYSKIPDLIISTLEELQRRGTLHVALSGHTDRTIVQLLRFVVERIEVPQLTDLLIVVLDLIFDIYGEAARRSVFFHRELLVAHKRVGEILHSLKCMEQSIGLMELIVEGQ